jgi:RHS repeat-associated protein
VVYVHGHGIDQPLAIVRYDYNDSIPAPVMLLPHTNSSGGIDTATYVSRCYTYTVTLTREDDSTATVNQPPAQQRCLQAPYPARYRLTSHESTAKDVSGPVSWMGSLITDSRDASGLMFRRNRYYDPQSGRFTQEDPIGLAGGVNVYGFAAGDPVNYSDPYGLKIVFGRAGPRNDEDRQRQRAIAYWESLYIRAHNALGSDDPEIRESARQLLALMVRMQQDKTTTYVIRTYKFNEAELTEYGHGYGAPERTGQRPGQVMWEVNVDTGTKEPVRVFAHELGGAESQAHGGLHDEPAVNSENNYRRIRRACAPRRDHHDSAAGECP